MPDDQPPLIETASNATDSSVLELPRPRSLSGLDLLIGVAAIWAMEIVLGIALAVYAGFDQEKFF